MGWEKVKKMRKCRGKRGRKTALKRKRSIDRGKRKERRPGGRGGRRWRGGRRKELWRAGEQGGSTVRRREKECEEKNEEEEKEGEVHKDKGKL